MRNKKNTIHQRQRKRRSGRLAKNTAHVLRAILLEGLGAAVLLFLFLTTRFTPEQLEQFSLKQLFEASSNAEDLVTSEVPSPLRVQPPRRASPIETSFVQPVLDVTSRYQVEHTSGPVRDDRPIAVRAPRRQQNFHGFHR